MLTLHIVYKPIFGKIVLNLDNINNPACEKAFLDFYNTLNYNILVYVLMEFREHALLTNYTYINK